jgi:excisionase family DNA binding protein
MKSLLTPEELIKVLKISSRSLYRMLEKNELPFALKIGGSWRFKEEDFIKWLDEKKIEKEEDEPLEEKIG